MARALFLEIAFGRDVAKIAALEMRVIRARTNIPINDFGYVASQIYNLLSFTSARTRIIYTGRR